MACVSHFDTTSLFSGRAYALLPPEREVTDQIDIQRKLPFDLFIFELLVHRRFLLMLH